MSLCVRALARSAWVCERSREGEGERDKWDWVALVTNCSIAARSVDSDLPDSLSRGVNMAQTCDVWSHPESSHTVGQDTEILGAKALFPLREMESLRSWVVKGISSLHPCLTFHCCWLCNILGPQLKLTINIKVSSKHKLFKNPSNFSTDNATKPYYSWIMQQFTSMSRQLKGLLSRPYTLN